MRNTTLRSYGAAILLMAGTLFAGGASRADHAHVSKPFQGVKANTGTVSHTYENGRHLLTLSDDFKIPDAPAPHWQIVDTQGHPYLLQRLDLKGGKFNRQIALPAYIGDVAKVQIWCAWAEVLLGETTFDSPIRLLPQDADSAANRHVSGPFQGVKANTGTVAHTKQGNQNILTLSDDFKVPDAPAPHWQIVDSQGRTYLLQRLKVKEDRFHKSIVLPAYIPDVAKVQIWCAWAQTLLGEATFATPVK